jgi:hypothetical protein
LGRQTDNSQISTHYSYDKSCKEKNDGASRTSNKRNFTVYMGEGTLRYRREAHGRPFLEEVPELMSK